MFDSYIKTFACNLSTLQPKRGSSNEFLISCTHQCCVVDLLRLQTIYSNTKHFDKTFQNHDKIAYYTPIIMEI